MSKLIAVDFKRVFKDKLFLVVCILAGVFALITPLLYAAICLIPGVEDVLVDMGMGFNAKTLFFESFSPGNNMGLIAPLLISIIFWKDFSHGTIRNKIISGQSRSSIILSMYTVCQLVLFGVLFLHALLSMVVSLIFFPYQSEPFAASDIGYFFASLALEFLLCMVLSALACWLCCVSNNMGLVIVGYLAITMILSILLSLLSLGSFALSTSEKWEIPLKIVGFFEDINLYTIAATIGSGRSYSVKQLLYCILPNLVGTAGLMTWGILKFRKKDLK